MISLIIVAQNKWQDYATPFIGSIYRHAGWEVEVVLVDNGSPDPYQKEQFSEVIRLDPDENYNYMKALNAGARAASGDWLVFCNDDILCTGPFSDQINSLPKDFLYGNEIRQKSRAWGLEFQYIYGWMLIMHRTLWEDVGPYDEYYLHAGFDDLDFSWRSQRAGYALRKLELPFTHLADLPGGIHRRYKVSQYTNNMSRSKAHFLKKSRG